jgi:preprotein translocase subunit SecG
MITLFIILMITACVGLGFMVLIQNPKGGGLNANVSGLSNNFMGVKQTTDVLEKGTWIFVAVIAVLAMSSTLFLKAANGSDSEKGLINKVNTSTTSPQTAPVQAPNNTTTVPAQQAPGNQTKPAGVK